MSENDYQDDDSWDDTDWNESDRDDFPLEEPQGLTSPQLPPIPSSEPILDVIIVDEDAERISLKRRWIAGAIASLVLHAWFYSSLSSLTIEDREIEPALPILSRLALDEKIEEPDPVIDYELANPDDRELEQKVALNAKSIGQMQTDTPVVEAAPQLIDVNTPEMMNVAQVYDIPEGVEVDESLVVQGTTGESLIQMDAALDRVTWEIANNLKEKKCLVVWLVDASGSLIEQRKAVSKRLRRIYKELQALENLGEIPTQDRPLLSAVVTFGQQTNFITPAPTTNVDALVTALEKAPIDESGVENTFTAVFQVMQRWMKYRVDQGRRILVVTLTDEAGDDFSQSLNNAIGIVNRYGGRAYVIGPPAVFGKRQGFIPYLAPENGRTYQLPVDIGPETAMPETVQLPFWFEGSQNDYLSAGLAPYALARLVHETGGVYFMTSMTTSTGLAPIGSYSTGVMKLYEPDYRFGKIDDFNRDLAKHPIRRAVVAAGQLSLKYKAKGTPNLDMRVNPGNYLQTIANAQQTVAESTYMIDAIMQAFPDSLAKEYEKEPSPRWRMAYNLAVGRLLAQKLRNYEYNSACAQLKLLGSQDVATKSNHWIFRPDKTINYAPGTKKAQTQAEELLGRCVKEAPGTPWAVLAARELQYPFGIKVVERFIPPPPPPSANPANNVKSKKGVLLLAPEPKKPAAPQAPPPEPKLPKL